MGNLICCYGKDEQKRGGIGVKTLLRKTEKPGRKRKRIDDLVVDALKQEKRNEILKKKGVKKEDKPIIKVNDYSTNSTTADKRIEDKPCDDDKSKESNTVNDGQSANTSDLNNICQSISGENGTLFRYQVSDTSLKTESVSESCEVRDFVGNRFQDHYKGDLKEQLDITIEAGCDVEKFGLAYHEKSVCCLNELDNNTVDKSSDGVTEHKEVKVDDSKDDDSATELKDCESSSASGENGQDTERTQRPETDEISEKDDKDSENDLISLYEIEKENGRNEDVSDRTDYADMEPESELTEEIKIHNVYKENIAEMLIIDASSENVIEVNEEDNQRQNVVTREVGWQSETHELDENSLEVPEIDIVGDDEMAKSIRKYEEDKSGYNHNENINSDNQTISILKVHDDTDSSWRCDENTEKNDDNKTLDILKVHDTNNFTGYGDTGLTYYGDEDNELIDDNLALEPIPRSKSLPMKRWGSSNNLRANSVATKGKQANTRKDINSFKCHLNKLKQIYAHSKKRGQELKNHLQRTPTKRPAALKYRAMKLALNGEQKPQIKEITRLKKDPFNFTPKLRQLTERDRHGSISDLKWSRHMRAEVKRHIAMESAELDELMFLTGGQQYDDSEFDVCDEPRAPTPVPDFEDLRAPTPAPDFEDPRAPTPVPGCDVLYVRSLAREHDFPRNPETDSRCDPCRTRTSKMYETVKNLRERNRTDRIPHTRQSTPNRLTPCSRHSNSNASNYRLNTSIRDRKKAAFQTISRQFEKSFKDAEARRSQERTGHSRKNTSCVGIGRQNSFMNLGLGTNRRDN